MTKIAVLALLVTCGVVLPGCQTATGAAPPTLSEAVPAAHVSPNWTRTSIGKFTDPYGVGVNLACVSHCDVYVADAGARTVWKVAPNGSRHAIGTFPVKQQGRCVTGGSEVVRRAVDAARSDSGARRIEQPRSFRRGECQACGTGMRQT